ncbi:MAG: GntR family transcriptional regulator, partial [Actinomycetota bacterium]
LLMRRLSFSVRDELAGRITSGAIPPGSRLPTEPQLAEDLGVSRATLREALRSLEEDGFVTRRRGAGTFAAHRPRLRNNLDVNFGVTEAIRASGMRPGTVDAKVAIAPASPQEAAALDIGPGEPVVTVERVRTADERRVVFSRDVVAQALVGEDALARLGNGSVYDLLESAAGVAIQHGVVTIEPIAADRTLARKLKIPAGSLLLYLRQVDYDHSGDPILLSHEYHLGDAFEFSVVRRGPGRRFR